MNTHTDMHSLIVIVIECTHTYTHRLLLMLCEIIAGETN
jgi:hypothetical protein